MRTQNDLAIVSTAELRRRLNDADLAIVDVRPLFAYNGWRADGEARGGHIPRAVAFPSAWLESLDGGLDHLRHVIVDDALGLCAELDAAMAAHVESYVDEWRSTVDDADRLERFVSFVNAPDAPDPSISFGVERGQRVPVAR